ncbi:double-stranded RNA-specific editase 1-like isoform X2 [Argiope bruennichi]|uniref:Double-stranded RNA-specific editase 1 like protein n=2 Tax=Argiope bruennichi TaxID=94029 RepID=A0A8T0E2M8_ARGBR|nr:double-stranded RNA-specific editase 1-like isoform X2 [Argiope bruennichi]KAF8764151.1 Double-stranded RNA-specific editase 1 like protein [Argiope bruennichi]
MDQKIQTVLDGRNPEEFTEVNLDNSAGPSKLQLLQQFCNVEHLSLKNCSIANLKGFPKLPNLKKLDLSSNKISSTLFFLNGCPQLTYLDLSNNKIKDIIALKALGKLKKLQSLKFVGCEITQVPEYRKRVFHIVKNLKNLDGQVKTAEDAEDPKIDLTNAGNDPLNGSSQKKPKKRKSKGGDPPPKKLKVILPQKNALMQLNELKPGLKYVVESVSGPAHNPQFIVSVEVNGTKYVGHGTSKQLAKHAAAQLALASFVQFRNTPEALTAINNPVVQIDFTSDEKNDGFSFNKPESHKNGSDLQINMDNTGNNIPKNSLKILSDASKKNPVMLLNEIHPGLEYKLVDENSTIPSQRFRMKVEVDGVTFEGTGPNKKQAKASAARSVMSNLYKVSYNTYGLSLLAPNSIDADLFNFPQHVADRISHILSNTFNEVMTGNVEHAKWKVIAGIAMTTDEAMEDIKIVSIGTGTKCINGEHISMVGANLNDCHAEIISRRCLKDFFYTNLEMHLEGEENKSIFIKTESGGFQLKPNIKFHLYISTAPCGDARIFCPHEEGAIESMDRHPNRNSRGALRTKIESGEGTIPIRSGQGIQTWDGILPGQERLLTMSCSDKIASWNVLGLQGALLSHFIEPIYLDSVILGGLFHPSHLKRALFGRIENSIKELPSLFKLNKPKMCPTSSPETRHLAKSPNFSVNWTSGLGRAEVVNATTGKMESGQVSRLSKRSFFQRFLNIYDRLPHIINYETPKPGLYALYKNVVQHYQVAKRVLTSAFSDAGLGNWVKKPIEQNEFELLF